MFETIELNFRLQFEISREHCGSLLSREVIIFENAPKRSRNRLERCDDILAVLNGFPEFRCWDDLWSCSRESTHTSLELNPGSLDLIFHATQGQGVSIRTFNTMGCKGFKCGLSELIRTWIISIDTIPFFPNELGDQTT